MKTIPIDSAEHWHSLRAQHVGGSEIGALFGLSPYITHFALWHDKAGNAGLPDPEQDDPNGRVAWGKRIEPAIAQGVSDLMRWHLEPRKVYVEADDAPRVGATLDYFVTDHADGPGFVECKLVDWIEFKEKWSDAHAPAHIELQVQHQFAATGYPWGAIACLVGGNDLHIYERKPHAQTLARIKGAVSDFWRSIDEKRAPDPFGSALELDTLRAIYSPPNPDEVIDLTGDPVAFEAANMLAWASAQALCNKKTADDCRAKLMAAIGKAQKIIIPGFDIRRRKDGPIHKCEMLPGAEAPVPKVLADFI